MALSEEQREIIAKVAEVLENSEEFDSVDLHGSMVVILQDGVECTLHAGFASDDGDEEEDDDVPEIIGTDE